MKPLSKRIITLCCVANLILTSFSYASTDNVLAQDYTLTYNNKQETTSLIVENGELYLSISVLTSLLGLDTTIEGATICLRDTSTQVNDQVDRDGNIYTGTLLNGKRHGYGTLYIQEGGKYEGNWENGLYQGTGTLILADGNIYVGDFSKGFIHGQGTMFYPDGSYYKGSHFYGVRQGFGLYFVNNDNKYEGYWENGLRNGKGKAYIDGKYKKGIFENNQFIKSLAESSFDF